MAEAAEVAEPADLGGSPPPPSEPPAPITPPVPPAEPGQPPADPSLAGKPEAGPPAAPFDAAALKLPQGFKADDKLLNDFGALMSDGALGPQDRGQKLLDLYAGAIKQVGEANTKAWTDMQTQWVNEVKADRDLGGTKLDSTLQGISKVIDTLGPDSAKAFRTALDVTGAGNNPAVIRALASWAKALTEGGHVPGNPGSQQSTREIGALFFPNSQMKD